MTPAGRAPDTLRLAASYGPTPELVAVQRTPALLRMLAGGEPTALQALDDGAVLASLDPAGATLLYPLQHRGRRLGCSAWRPANPPRAGRGRT